jgi:tryptophanyl-tRNA synthetase
VARVFSGIQPSGDVHLGNLLGALRNWVRDQDEHDAVYCVVDLHAVTTPAGADGLEAATLKLTQMLIAVGIDPAKATLFVQSHVREHSELAWLLQCTIAFGELRRMTQFKDKSDGADFVSAGLFTYPALQAADILLYDTDKVPVGDDQRQHIELTRDVAERYNSRWGRTFVVPEHVIPKSGARVMDLQEPTNKMSKSAGDAPGTIWLLDPPKTIEKKIKRAVTDSDNAVFYDPTEKAGVSNLLDILGAATDRDPIALADEYEQYGPLKSDCAEAVVELLAPIQARYQELSADQAETRRLLGVGAERARERASATVERAKANLGFLAG